MAAPPGPVAAPLVVSVVVPGAIASKRTAARSPVPDAPVESPARVSVMSIRPALVCWVKTTSMPPVRMKLPCCADRTRSFVGSYMSVSDTVDKPSPFVTEIGTVYGPPPTRRVGGGERTICAWPSPDDVVGVWAAGSGGTGGNGGVVVSGAAGDGAGPGGAAPGTGVAGVTRTVPGTG